MTSSYNNYFDWYDFNGYSGYGNGSGSGRSGSGSGNGSYCEPSNSNDIWASHDYGQGVQTLTNGDDYYCGVGGVVDLVEAGDGCDTWFTSDYSYGYTIVALNDGIFSIEKNGCSIGKGRNFENVQFLDKTIDVTSFKPDGYGSGSNNGSGSGSGSNNGSGSGNGGSGSGNTGSGSGNGGSGSGNAGSGSGNGGSGSGSGHGSEKNSLNAVDDEANTEYGQTVSINVMANDNDPQGDDFHVSYAGNPANGTATILSNGQIEYTPNDGFSGTDTFEYTITDDKGLSTTATVSVTVKPDDNSVDANEDHSDVVFGEAKEIDVRANDSDEQGDDFDVTDTTNGANGTVTILANGNVEYTPNDGFSGDDSFTYTITDENGATDTATVYVHVKPDTNTTDAVDDTADVAKGEAKEIDVRANDTDAEGDDFDVTAVTDGANGTVTILPNGNVEYTPNAGFEGNDSFTYTITDANGATDTATVNVTVKPDANSVDAVDDLGQEGEMNTSKTIDVLANDTDAEGDDFKVTGTTDGANGTVTINADGTVKYTPNTGFVGQDTFTYTITDDKGATDTATVTIDVKAPTNTTDAVDDTADVAKGEAKEIDVRANDTDAQGDDFDVTAVTDGANGTVTILPNGNVEYTPNAGFEGNDSFTYTITDENGATDTATVNVTVKPDANSVDAVDDLGQEGEMNTSKTIDVLANDTDAEGDDFKVTGTTDGANGTVTINADGTVKYTPNTGFVGQDTFTYTITDDKGATDTATVTIDVKAPTNTTDAVDDAADVAKGEAKEIDVRANDTDPEGDAFDVTSTTNGANGTVTILPNGNVEYTPNAGFEGNDSFTYTITDENGATDTATVKVTVKPDANSVDAVDDLGQEGEMNTSKTIDVLANDTDAEGDDFKVTGTTDGANGTVTINADGTVKYTPNTGFVGQDTFTYTITDDKGATDTATVTIDVKAPTNTTDAVDDAADVAKGEAKEIDVRANDTDPEGDAFDVTSTTNGANGTVTILPNGNVEYTPNAGFEGNDSFTYTITDENGATDTATVKVTVKPDANSVDAVDDLGQEGEMNTSKTIDVLANDTDAEGDDFKVTGTTDGANGTVTINADGTVKYTPNTGFVGQDTFTYTITDDKGATDTATVTIDVKAPANTTDAVNDASDATKDKPQEIDVLANDTDAEGDDFKVTDTTDGLNGTVKILPNGKVEYTPNTGFVGTDIFTYTITDDKGATDTATVTVTVKDDVPANTTDAVNDASDATKDKPQEIDVLANDKDAEGDDFKVTDTTDGLNGTVKILPNGKVEYTPNAGFVGTDTFTYTITDDKGATDTATVTVTVKDDVPANTTDAVNDASDATKDKPQEIDVLANDTDAEGDDFKVTDTTDGLNGTVKILPNGKVEYTPNTGFVGTDIFTYTITDDKGATDTATVTVTVKDDVPANTTDAVNDASDATKDKPQEIDVLANDTDAEGDDFKVTDTTDGLNGTVKILPNGKVEYTPNAGFVGTDTFTYTITDDKGATDTATVTVTVKDDVPANTTDAVNDASDATKDKPQEIDVLANDTDAEGDDFKVTDTTDGLNGTVKILPNGKVEYTPNTGFVGTDIFTYTITDDKGATDTATVTVTVKDDVPANSVDAVDDAAVAEMDKPQEIDVLSNDTDPEGDTFTVTDVTNGANGTVKILPNGKVEYTPNAGFTGSDTFTYTVTDANGATDTATVTVDVKDTAPANSVDAVDDVANAAYDTPVKINVLSNDSDPEGDAFTVTSVTDGQGGTVTIAADGQVIYTPNPGVYGVDTFTYTITDAKGATSTATVSVTIEGPTDPANSVVAVDDTAVAAHDTPVKIDVVGNDTDPEGDAFTVTSVTDGQGGSVTIAADGQVIYTPNPGVYGVDTFTYTITDAKGATSTATVSVTIEGPTDPTNSVDAVKDIAWAVEDTPVTIDVVANDSDPEGDYFEVTSVTNGQGGTVSIAADGQVLYTPNAGFVGEDVFTYTITDSKGATSTAEVCVTVEASGEPAGPDCGEPTVVGTDATDFLYGTAGNDVIQAGGGNDVIYTSAGDDCIDGGEGFDQVVYQGCTTDYAFTQNEDGSVTATANDGSGVDLLMDIEGIYFEETCEWFTVDDLC